MRLSRLAYLCALVGLFACADDVSEAGGTGGGSEGSTSDGTTTGTGTTTGVDASSSTTADATGETTGSPQPIEYAHGIRLERLTANQGVQVVFVQGGAEVAAEDYGIRMIRGRRTLIRGFWSLHAEFEPRELTGQITVDYPDGTTYEQEFTQMVEGDSNESASASFQWLLEPEQVVPGMQVRARVLEPDPATAPGEVSDPPPVAPLAGPTELIVADQDMDIEIVLVPILHQFDGCEQAPDITEEDRVAMQRLMEENNPVQRALVTVREPLPYTESVAEGGSFSPVNAALADAKMSDGAAAHVYYYGVIDSCDGFPGGLLGQAIDIPDAPLTLEEVPNATLGRISSGRWFGSGAAAAETFVHEVGHTQSRYHIRCSGGEGGPDLSYPHLGGRIGAWGFGIYDFALRGPTVGRDYMTYCSNAWVSDFGWELTYDVIAVLTAYAATADSLPPPTTQSVLVGQIDGDYEAWWIEDAPGPIATPGDFLRLETSGVPIDVPARVRKIPHSDYGQYIRVALPTTMDTVTGLALETAAGSHVIDLTAVRR